MAAEDVFCSVFHLRGTDIFISGNLQIRAEKPVAKEEMPWQAKFLLNCSAGSWSWRLSHNNYLLSPVNVFFLFCSCTDSTAPTRVCPSFHKSSLSFGRAWICPVQHLISSATGCSTHIRSMDAPVSKSILNLLRLLKCSKAAPPYPGRCLTCIWETPSTPPLPPANSCWVKWVEKAPIKSRFMT